jgi:hypothetical protein
LFKQALILHQNSLIVQKSGPILCDIKGWILDEVDYKEFDFEHSLKKNAVRGN